MTLKVIGPDGMLGNTVASTTWTRSNPCGLPQRSLSNRDGCAHMGKLPPVW